MKDCCFTSWIAHREHDKCADALSACTAEPAFSPGGRSVRNEGYSKQQKGQACLGRARGLKSRYVDVCKWST